MSVYPSIKPGNVYYMVQDGVEIPLFISTEPVSSDSLCLHIKSKRVFQPADVYNNAVVNNCTCSSCSKLDRLIPLEECVRVKLMTGENN